MVGEKSVRNYIRGHLYDVASEEKIKNDDTTIPEVIDDIINMGGNFGSTGELQKAILGYLSQYKADSIKKPELVSVSKKIAYKVL